MKEYTISDTSPLYLRERGFYEGQKVRVLDETPHTYIVKVNNVKWAISRKLLEEIINNEKDISDRKFKELENN